MKTGDDLRQDAIVMQFVRIMDYFWRQSGLDLNIITFKIVPSGRAVACRTSICAYSLASECFRAASRLD
jgi:hypothetical protein